MLYIPFINDNFQVPITHRFRNLTYLVILSKGINILSVREIANFLRKNVEIFRLTGQIADPINAKNRPITPIR